MAREFLEYLGVDFEPVDLCALEGEPPDVLFLGARFKIKEILDPDRKRGTEYKDTLRKAGSAKHLRDLLEPYSPKSVTVDEAAASVAEESRRWKKRYAPAVVRQLDLLFYFNLQECGVIPFPIQIWNNVLIPHLEVSIWRERQAVLRYWRRQKRFCQRLVP